MDFLDVVRFFFLRIVLDLKENYLKYTKVFASMFNLTFL